MRSSLANRGRPFEDLLNLAHSRYQASGQACVHKVPTEFLPLRDRRGQVAGCKVEHKSCVDYLGRYYNIPVAVEAKHTESGRIHFDRVEQHQAEYLDDFCRSPAAIGLVDTWASQHITGAAAPGMGNQAGWEIRSTLPGHNQQLFAGRDKPHGAE